MSTPATHRGWVPADSFANRLVLVRREQGLSVKEAALRCGLHYATWSTWENGRKPADLVGVVLAISDNLGVNRNWLMWGSVEPPGPDAAPSGGPDRDGDGEWAPWGSNPQPTVWVSPQVSALAVA